MCHDPVLDTAFSSHKNIGNGKGAKPVSSGSPSMV
jgi:hypothetical protein